MLYLRYGLYLMALGATLRAPEVRAEAGHGFQHSLLRRFLYTPNTLGQFCSMCFIQCQNGYIQSSTGCLLCVCATNHTTSQPQLDWSTTVMVNGGIFLNNPCNPAVRHCHYQCTLGYKVGTNGCQHCICNEPASTSGYAGTTTVADRDRAGTTPSTTKSASTVPASSPSHPPLQTTSLVTTVRMTSAPFGKAGSFTDPCISTQKTCNKDCPNGYVKGPEGCQYCLCMTASMVTTTTTTPVVPATGSTLPTPAPHYLDLTPTSEACIMAKVICNDKCPSGFVSHPDDCLFCACHKGDQDDDPEEDDDELQIPVSLAPEPVPVAMSGGICRRTQTLSIMRMCITGIRDGV